MVTSTNNSAVDVAVDRADRDVGCGLLIRTGNRDVRDQVPARIATAKAWAESHSGNQATARARLKRAADKRTQLLRKLARLDKLDADLLRVAEQRTKLVSQSLKAAQTLWASGSIPAGLTISAQGIRQCPRVERAGWKKSET